MQRGRRLKESACALKKRWLCDGVSVSHIQRLIALQVRLWDIRTSGCIHVFDQHDTNAASSIRQDWSAPHPLVTSHIARWVEIVMEAPYVLHICGPLDDWLLRLPRLSCVWRWDIDEKQGTAA